MQRIFDIIPVVAESDATILIEGPTGTGKDLLAKVIHQASHRAEKQLIKVNCAALPDSLLESEMFGYAKGAFTGAERDKPGRFQDADGGTIFLDEIGDMPFALQAKLLRVLEDGEFYALGGRKPTRVDVRIISATNQELEKLVREKKFREDLFYRLNVMRIEMPPLKHRTGDLPLLIAHILKRLSTTRGRRLPDISESAMDVLLNHDYPGNIRELENILEHALIVCREGIINRSHLPTSLRDRSPHPPVLPKEEVATLSGDVQASEKSMILSALKEYRWHRGDTATALKIDRSTLWRKMKRYGLFPE
jgi:transcriptional regulator with PAS, ATPase and Fis domain